MPTLPTTQAPGFQRRRVGDIVVTAVNDGMAVGSFDLVRGIEAADAEAVMRAAFRGAAPTLTFNTYLVQDAARTILIDTGGGGLMGPVAGRLQANLAAAGVDPADVDVILLTHLHIDHFGGMIDGDGHAVFGRAEVFVPEPEAAFWLDPAGAAQMPDAVKAVAEAARTSLAPYGDRVHRFTGAEPVPGIHAESLPGHTPGHTGYRIPGPDGGLLIWGDIVHIPDLQARRPEAVVIFDADPTQAEATRRATLAMAATERLMVAGMHMNFPGFAYVEAMGEGYRLIPALWTPEL